MEQIMILHIVFIVLMFLLNLLCIFLPIKIIPRDPEKLSNKKSQRIISFCGCISGGVFLGTCYVQLIPFLNKKFTQIFLMTGTDIDYSSMTTQCVVMLGFFLILFVEQSIKVWQENKANRAPKKSYTVLSNLPEEVIELPDGYIASSSDNSLSEESDIDDPKQSMLHHHKSSPQSKAVPKNAGCKPADRVSQNNSNSGKSDLQVLNSSHGCHSHEGHGHSHLNGVFETHGFRSFLLMAALGIHSLFEGMAVGLQESIIALINLFLGVLLHECLISFSVGVSLAQQQAVLKRSLIIKLCIMFSATIPLGMAIGLAIGGMQGLKAELTSAIVQGIAAGTFIYVIFFEILPAEISSNDKRLLKVLFMVIGFGIILCLQFSMKEIH